MTYKVVFRKRFNTAGEESDRPETFVNVTDDVVLNASKSEVIESAAQHSQDVLDEDDAFLGMAGTETWEYEIATGREQEFIDALKNSGMVLQYEAIDEVI